MAAVTSLSCCCPAVSLSVPCAGESQGDGCLGGWKDAKMMAGHEGIIAQKQDEQAQAKALPLCVCIRQESRKYAMAGSCTLTHTHTHRIYLDTHTAPWLACRVLDRGGCPDGGKEGHWQPAPLFRLPCLPLCPVPAFWHHSHTRPGRTHARTRSRGDDGDRKSVV